MVSLLLDHWFGESWTVSCVAGRDGGMPPRGGCFAESRESGEDGRRKLQGELAEGCALQRLGGQAMQHGGEYWWTSV